LDSLFKHFNKNKLHFSTNLLLLKKVQNKQSSVTSIKWLCARCGNCEKMNEEELYVPDDILEEASAASYQMLPKKSKLRCQKELEKFTREQKSRVKDSKRKTMSESEVNRVTF
jgi:hypothetical protein